jgi:large exoprotein involved in heme utilization and adhesion
VINTGTLRLENGAALSARTRGVARGGDITVNVNNLDITGGAQILTTAFSSGAAGGITVNATGNVTISGIDPTFFERFNQIRDAFIAEGVSPEQAIKNAQFTIDPVDASSSLQAQALNRISQGSGNIIIEAGSLSLMNGGQLTANTYGRGNAGNIDIKVRDTVSLSGLATLRRDGVSSLLNSGIFSLVGEGAVDANGGNINIKARSLFMADRSEIGVGTFGIGNAGNVSVQVDDSVALDQVSSIRSNVEPRGIGKGGNVDIQARSLTLTNGGQIGAFVFRAENNKLGGTGQGGDITINAWDSVSISGFSADPLNPGLSFSSGLLASTENGAVGPGGTITVNTGNLFIADSGFITAATENNSKAGSVFLNVNDQLTVQNEGVVLVSGLAQGDPGNLVITAGSVFLNQGGRLEAISNSGKNANISLTVSDSIQLRSTDPFLSKISAQAFNQGDGGNIDIIAGNNIVGVRAENSDILANAYGGNGGNITAVARTGGVIGFNDSKVPTPESDFIASSELALDGTVEIETQDKLQEALPIN